MILEFKNLKAEYFRSSGRPLVLACGCFDLLTVGHVRHLQSAKENGCLLVLVTADEHVNKGTDRPIFSQKARAEVVNALRCVDYVAVNPYPTAVEAIRSLCPQVYVKGREYKNLVSSRLVEEVDALESLGGRLEFTETEEDHTTDVVTRIIGEKVLG